MKINLRRSKEESVSIYEELKPKTISVKPIEPDRVLPNPNDRYPHLFINPTDTYIRPIRSSSTGPKIMIICNDCKKEMHCEHTGTKVRFGPLGDHVYAGDTFECPTCHKKTTVCNKNPNYEEVIYLSKTDIIMDPITDRSKIKKRPINLRKTTIRKTEEPNGRTDTNGGPNFSRTSENFDSENAVKEILKYIEGWNPKLYVE